MASPTSTAPCRLLQSVSSGTTSVGGAGAGELTIADAAVISSVLRLGDQAGGRGTLTLTGTHPSLAPGWLIIGGAGNGVLEATVASASKVDGLWAARVVVGESASGTGKATFDHDYLWSVGSVVIGAQGALRGSRHSLSVSCAGYAVRLRVVE